jgi:hypothetical protein
MECIGVGSITTTTQIILDNNWCKTLLTLAIQSVRASSKVTFEPCRSFLLCTNLLTEGSSTYSSVDVFETYQISNCNCWLSRKFCLSGCCFDTELRNRYLGSDLVICRRFPWKAPTLWIIIQCLLTNFKFILHLTDAFFGLKAHWSATNFVLTNSLCLQNFDQCAHLKLEMIFNQIG